jgi:hypothetical protein
MIRLPTTAPDRRCAIYIADARRPASIIWAARKAQRALRDSATKGCGECEPVAILAISSQTFKLAKARRQVGR